MEHAKLILIFNAVLKYGSMNAAAVHLKMTASAVSQHIKKLEDFYQTKLLNRTTRKLTLTEAGKVLRQYGEQLEALLAQTDGEMQSLRAEPAGSVKIAMPTTCTALPEIQQAVTAIRTRFPAINLVLQESEQIGDLWGVHSADIAIRVVPQVLDEDSIARPLATWQTVICAAPDYLQKHPVQRPQDLLTADWLNYHDEVLRKTLTQLGLPDSLPENRIDCPDNALSAKALAKLGLGLTIFLTGHIRQELANGGLVQVLPEHPLPSRTLYAVTLTRTQSAKNQAVLGVLKEVFEQYGKSGI